MSKIGIIGAGQVGASCAFALAQAGLAREIALADIKEEKARGEALDIAHCARSCPPCACRAADMRLLTAQAWW